MNAPDYIVKLSEDDTQHTIALKIFYTLFVKRLQQKKPVVLFMGGGSGEGKSWSVVKFEEILAELQGFDVDTVFDTINVYTPLEYPKKIRSLLFPQKYYKKGTIEYEEHRKANIIAVHEARNIVKAKHWHSFVNQAIGDVNAMSRSIKRLCFMIVSQYIRDISLDVRYTLNYYITTKRDVDEQPRLFINRMWQDDRDVERPVLKKRKIRGYLVKENENGTRKYIKHFPSSFELLKPSSRLTKRFDKHDSEAKSAILNRLIDKLIKEMSSEFEGQNTKLEQMVKHFSERPERLQEIGHMTGTGKWKINKEVAQMHDLTPSELQDFQNMLNKRLQNKMRDPEEPDQKEDEQNGETPAELSEV